MKLTLSITWVCVLVAAGCGSPTKPSSEQSMAIRGMVSDRTGNPLAGAHVEILTGSRAGMKIRTDRSGKFELLAETAPALQARIAGEQVMLRVSHNGFQSRTVEDGWSSGAGYPPGFPLTGLPVRVIWLDHGPTIDLEPGAYTLTTSIDLAKARDFLPRAPCRGFPAEFASRSFPATIELRDRAIELYQVTVETRPSTTIFLLYRVGRFLEVYVEPSLIAEMPGFHYLSIGGGTSQTTEPPSDTGTSVSVPFYAVFQYCQLRSPLGIGLECQHTPPENVVAYNSCTSESVTMTFTKR
jgi:hypothetical protein